jgi:hypothetical protein
MNRSTNIKEEEMVTTVKAQYTKIDTDGKDGISEKEWQAFLAKNPNMDPADIIQIEKDGKLWAKGAHANMNAEIANSGGNADPSTDTATIAELKQVEQEMKALVAQLREAKGNAAKEEQLRTQLKEMVAQAEQLNGKLTNGSKALKLNAFKKAAGMSTSKSSGSFKASTAAAPKGGAGGAKASSTGAAGASFSAPANWGAQTAGATFNSSAQYMSSMAIEDDIMSSMDNINKNQNRGKQLMMLFFYFSKMAQSGDMGAMYQFMKFLTYIISKDKAKQQIDMGKKLIQLQDLSRQWTNKLMNLSTDSADPSASNELMKQMTLVKSETDAIATSQKLISQMMEEFAQVVESLTNSTKSALDAYGRILRTVSQSR